MKILVAGPYIGELGFESCNWMPHLAAIRKDYDSMVVFSRRGHEDIYPFADTFIGFDFGLEVVHCDQNWMIQPLPGAVAAFNLLENQVRDYTEALKVDGNQVSLLLSDVQMRRTNFNDRFPIVLHGSAKNNEKWGGILPPGPKIVLPIRSYRRGAAKNTSPVLIDTITSVLRDKINPTFILIGHEELPFQCKSRSSCIDLLNKTTISDLISIYALSDMVIGAVTGTMHLAAPCGIPHVTWLTCVAPPGAIEERFLTQWNLTKTPVEYIDTPPDVKINPNIVIEKVMNLWKRISI